MEKSLLTEVKAILKSLVLSCPDKITVQQLNRDYRDVEGQFIPFRMMGYGNLEEFLRSVPDTLRVFGNGPTAMVCFVANEKSDHIHDMIMSQKKSKSKTQLRSKTNNSWRNTVQRSNRINSYSPQPRSVVQTLPPYESVNRNHATKTIQVRDVPFIMQNTKPMPIPATTPMLYALPQANAVILNNQQSLLNPHTPILSSVKNGVIKPVGNQAQVQQLCNLIQSQCFVKNLPPALPRQENRFVRFPKEQKSSEIVYNSNEKKSSGEIVEDTNKVYQSKEAPEVEKALQKSSDTSGSPMKINSQTPKKLPIKLPDDVEIMLDMPKLRKVNNPIKETCLNMGLEDYIKLGNRSETTESVESKKFFDDSTEKFEDPDEAVPSFAAKNNVFSLDFPEHTVAYGNKLPPYKLTDNIKIGSCIKIFISEIHNPFKFWFHIHKENHELDLLMYQMEQYYSSLYSEDLCIPVMCLTPGQVCAASYKGLWHRAEVVAPPVNTNIKVSFMDYGTVTEVEIENVKFLQSYFAQLPAQALRGCLSHIKPREFHWSHDATTYFLTLVAELLLYAKITEIDREQNILYMVLCDTNGDEVVQINSSLVENRYACYNDDWKSEKIKMNNGKRKRHPLEDFPTFSMIESGEYPSFSELVSLHQRGIDYEAIYDKIIYNQSSILNKHESASEALRNLPYFLTTSNPFRSEILLHLYATTS